MKFLLNPLCTMNCHLSKKCFLKRQFFLSTYFTLITNTNLLFHLLGSVLILICVFWINSFYLKLHNFNTVILFCVFFKLFFLFYSLINIYIQLLTSYINCQTFEFNLIKKLAHKSVQYLIISFKSLKLARTRLINL